MVERRPETSAPIVLTTGEPAGIGPDLVVQLLQQPLPGSFCVVTDPTLLLERARAIGLDLEEVEGGVAGPGGHLGVVPLLLRAPCSPGATPSGHRSRAGTSAHLCGGTIRRHTPRTPDPFASGLPAPRMMTRGSERGRVLQKVIFSTIAHCFLLRTR